MKNIKLSAIFVSSAFMTSVHANTSVYDVALKAKSCHESYNQSIECNYKIGNDLWISIPSLGSPDVAVTFMKADFDGDYYATYGVMHGCVIVKPGKKTTSKDPFD